MSENNNENPVNQTHNSMNNRDNAYEAMVQRLAFAAVNEQRRARRWRIFFILLTFLYLTPLLLLTVDLNDINVFKASDKEGEKHTALVRLNGLIAGGEAASSETMVKGLQDAFESENTAAVVLEINSPGGTPVQSADIHDEMKRLREKYPDIPLYAVVQDMAASGGYFVAAAADRIFVNKSSLVGSIGVRMDSFGLVGLIEKIGIERRLLTAGENKGLLDPFLPEDPQQKEHMQETLNYVHQHFISAVKEGRGERLSDSANLFNGLIWTGEQAIELGLVDELGSTDYVAREIVKQETIVDFTPRELLFDRLADRVGARFAQTLRNELSSIQLQ